MHTAEYQYIHTSHKSQIFLAHYKPAVSAASADARAVILVPPFAEEMNRSKRMYVLCARMLANAGVHAICFDYSGTGDSSGEWGEFSYQEWVSDLRSVYEYAINKVTHIDLIALRFGVLLSMDVMLSRGIQVDKCIFWDPLETGEMLTRQLIRMKIAAAMADNSRKVTSQQVWESIDESGYLESAGYHISRAMIDEINAKKLAVNIAQVSRLTNVHWMTLGKFKEGESKWLANSFKPEDLQADKDGGQINMHPVNDTKFWMQQEVTISPQLLRMTREVIVGGK